MNIRKALINEEGVVVNVVVADTDWQPTDGLTAIVDTDGQAETGGLYQDGFFSPPLPVYKTKSLFEGSYFLSRLTDQEYSNIISASQVNSQISRWLDIFRLRGEIDVLGSTAQNAKAGLVAAGLITSDRAEIIFATEQVRT